MHSASNAAQSSGVFSPVVTPFKRNLTPDADRLVRHCRWLLANNVGLAVFGTNSEANSLSVDERIGLLDEIVGAGIPASRMMPGTGCCAITDSARLTRAAVNMGCGSVLMLPPFFYKVVSDEGLFRNYAEIIDRVGDERLRIYLYNIPAFSGVSIGPRLVERLLAHFPGTVAGMKDSSGDWTNTQVMLDNFASSGFGIFVGSESFLLGNMRRGGKGCISATANVNPGPIARLFSEWQTADAERQQAALEVIRAIFQRLPMIPAMKAAIAHFGRDPAWSRMRPPLTELSDDQHAALIRDLSQAGFSMAGRESLAIEAMSFRRDPLDQFSTKFLGA